MPANTGWKMNEIDTGSRCLCEPLESRWLLSEVVYSSAGAQEFAIVRGGLFDEQLSAMAVQPDGKILAAGRMGYPMLRVARFTSDGELDTGFGREGFAVLQEQGNNSWLMNVAVQPDGKIVVAGRANHFDNYSPIRYEDFFVARLNADGTPDVQFGERRVSFDSDGEIGNEVGVAMVIQPDGKILLGGGTSLPWKAWGIHDTNFAMARLNPDGALDDTFGNGGKVVTDFGPTPAYEGWYSDFDTISALAVQSDGKILALGHTMIPDPPEYRPPFGVIVASHGYHLALIRYNSDGSVDATFGENGRVELAARDARAEMVTVLADGKILVGAKLGATKAVLVRYNPDGSLDTTYGADGTGMVLPFAAAPYGDVSAQEMTMGPDGKIWMGINGMRAARLSVEGTVERIYGNAGSALLPPGYPVGGVSQVLPIAGGVAGIGSVSKPYSSSSDLNSDAMLVRFLDEVVPTTPVVPTPPTMPVVPTPPTTPVVPTPPTTPTQVHDLSFSFSSLPTKLLRGKRIKVLVTIRNVGTVRVFGRARIMIAQSADTTFSKDDVRLFDGKPLLNLKPGQSKTVAVWLKAPKNVGEGRAFLIGKCIAPTGVADQSTSNNVTVSKKRIRFA